MVDGALKSCEIPTSGLAVKSPTPSLCRFEIWRPPQLLRGITASKSYLEPVWRLHFVAHSERAVCHGSTFVEPQPHLLESKEAR